MVICDIDGCLFKNLHRAHLVPEVRDHTPNWTEFNKACVNDEPILAVINLVKHLAHRTDHSIVFVTSRGENVRDETKAQLFHEFQDYGCRLIMRPMDDHRNTIDYKRDVISTLKDEFIEESIIIDDHPGIVEMVAKDFPKLNRLLVPSYDCTVVNVVSS
jgi:hypothetical protein